MKKIFLGLFACIFFLFSCNLEASFGGTNLVIPLPGSEAKIAKYDAGDVASYRVDITRNDGVHYSETGSAGGVIVFENILCGTYTVDIYALDGDTYVAARGSASIEIIKNEENYLSAEAVLQNKVTDFFVSVPKGVWNLDHARYFREKNYYSAVRDVEYGAYETVTDGGGRTNVTTAKIVNPDIEYAYLNCISSFDLGVQAGKSAKLSLYFKAEKKCKFSVSMVNSLKEEYGKTLFYEYDPNNAYNAYDKYMHIDDFEIGQVDNEWNPLVRICFSKDCGQVSVYDCRINTSNTTPLNLRYNAAVLPCDKELVSIDINDDNTKFTFDKRKAGSTYTAALFTGIQIEQFKPAKLSLEGIRVDKDVEKLSIRIGSYASDKKIYTSELKNYALKKNNEQSDSPYSFYLIVPPAFVYNSDYEDVFIEIHPEGWVGDTLEISFRDIYYMAYDQGFSFADLRKVLTEFYNLKDMDVSKALVEMQDEVYQTVLLPGESKTFGVSIYNNYDYCMSGAQLTTDVVTGQFFNAELNDGGYVPLVLHEGVCNVPGLSFHKTGDGKFYIKNNTSYDLPIQIGFNSSNDGIIINEPQTSITYSYSYDYMNTDQITTSGGSKKIRLSAIDTSKVFGNIRIKNLNIYSLSCIPVSGKVDMVTGNNQMFDGSTFEVKVKNKSGLTLGTYTIGDDSVETIVRPTFKDYYHLGTYFKRIKQKNYPVKLEIPGIYDTSDTIIEIYLVYPQNITGSFISVYDVNAGLDCSISN